MTSTKEWLNAFFEQTEDQFVLVDRDFIIRDANASFIKKFALPKNKVLGAACYRIFQKKEHPCLNNGDDCPLKIVQKTGEPASGFKTLRVNHHLYNARYSVFPIFAEGGGVRAFAMRFQAASDEKQSITPDASEDGRVLENLLDVIHELLEKMKDVHSIAEASRQAVTYIKKYFRPDIFEQIVIREKQVKIIQSELVKEKPTTIQTVAWEDFFAPEFSLDALLSKNIGQLDIHGQDVRKIFSKKAIHTFEEQEIDVIQVLFPHNVHGSVIFGIIGWKIPLPKLASNKQFFELFFLAGYLFWDQILNSEIVENRNHFLNILNEIVVQMIRGSSEKELISVITDELLNTFSRLVSVSFLTLDGTGKYWKVQIVKMKPSVQSGLTFLKNMKLIPVDAFNSAKKVKITENFDAVFPKLTPVQRDLYRGGIRASVRIPLIMKNELIGFLNLGFNHPLEIHFPVMWHQFEMLGNQMAIAINHCRMLAEREGSQKLWHHIVDSIPLGISVHDANWRVLQINKAVQEVLGLPESEIVGEKCYRLFHKMNHPIDDCPYLKLLQSKQPERSIMDIFGDGRQFEVVCYPVFGENGSITSYIHVIEDVTQKLAMQKEIFQKEKLATLGEIIAGVAHELNNPLTGVVGFADLLLEEQSDLPETIREDISIIQKEAQRSARIVKNLLTFARQTEVTKEPQDVNQIIEKTIELVEYDLKSKGITFVRKFGKNLPFILADFFQLQQVFINLINNASQAILSEKQSGKITFITRVVDNCVQITVEDDGPGMPPDILEKIFDPFFTTKEVGKGTGLGLSISFGIVHEHDGKITVRSKVGRGTVFTLRFPFMEDSEIFESDKEKSSSIQDVTGKKILIVDDEEVILSLLQLIYGKAGNQIEVAKNGKIALKKLQDNSFDLVLVDLRMPEMDGEQFFMQLKEKWPELTSRIIFMTGDAVSEQTQNFFNMNHLPYLIKPFDVNELKLLILNILSENSQ